MLLPFGKGIFAIYLKMFPIFKGKFGNHKSKVRNMRSMLLMLAIGAQFIAASERRAGVDQGSIEAAEKAMSQTNQRVEWAPWCLASP
jgi:hypothetical protein